MIVKCHARECCGLVGVSMSYSLQDKVVVVTGAANGIGAGVVRLALEEGAKHVAVLDIADNGPAFEEELNAQYGAGASKFYRCDVTDDEQLAAALRGAAARGGLHLVVNNAGIMNDSPGVYKKEIEVNVTALITSTLKALELMRMDEGGEGGTVINISSIAGLQQSPIMPIYFATKAAVIQFSNCIGKQDYFDKTGVRVVAVCFGATNTSLISPTKVGSFDKNIPPEALSGAMKTKLHVQKLESAARGVIEAYKRARSGSTWLASRDLPVRDITDNVTRGYQIMGEHN